MNKITVIFGSLFFIAIVTVVILIATGVIDLSSLFGSTTKTPGPTTPKPTTPKRTTPKPTTPKPTTTGPPNHTYPPTPIVTTPGQTSSPDFFGYSCDLTGQSYTQGKCYRTGRGKWGKFKTSKAC
jgi:hypothetical protein